MQVQLRIRRFNPEIDARPHDEEYMVEADPQDQVLDLLNRVKGYQDGTLAYRRSCGHGVCGSDAMRINGVNHLACKVLVAELGERITVEPLLGLRVLKDLIVDLEPFFAHYRSVMPYLVNDEPVESGERLQSPAERERYDDTTKCILCAACTSACPSFWADGAYYGPAAIVQGHRFLFDSRDRASDERLRVLGEQTGVWRCRTAFSCTVACPRGIQVTRAIGEVKQAIARGRVD
jgi:succinate dehydrogenase / fumarate reductase iron-sulfur subunit